MPLFVAESPVVCLCVAKDGPLLVTMCGNLVIRNQILTQFGLSYVLIRT